MYPEVVERPFNRLTALSHVEGHQVYAGYGAAPQNHITTATAILCACPRSVVRFGAVTGLAVFWVTELKRDPLALRYASWNLFRIMKAICGTRQ